MNDFEEFNAHSPPPLSQSLHHLKGNPLPKKSSLLTPPPHPPASDNQPSTTTLCASVDWSILNISYNGIIQRGLQGLALHLCFLDLRSNVTSSRGPPDIPVPRHLGLISTASDIILTFWFSRWSFSPKAQALKDKDGFHPLWKVVSD